MRRFALALTAGLLAAPGVPPATAAPPFVESRCRWILSSIPGSLDVLIVLVAQADAVGDLPAATTTVTCVAENVYRETLTASGTSLGPSAYAVSARVMRWDGPTVCVWGEGVWAKTEPLLATERYVEDVDCRHPGGQGGTS